MKSFCILALALLFGISGCSSVTKSSTNQQEGLNEEDLKRKVGQRIVVVGKVSESKIPRIGTIEVRELSPFRGQVVKVSGLLQQNEISKENWRPDLPGPGPGIYFYLTNVTFEDRQ